MNYKATFDFTKKESSYIAGSVYFVSMILAPGLGLVVVSQIDVKTNSFVEIVIKAAVRTGYTGLSLRAVTHNTCYD